MTCASIPWIPHSSRIPIRPTGACAPRTPFTRARSASGSSPATRTSRAALRDPRLAKEAIAAFVAARFGLAVPALGLSMLDRDPPDHTRLRGLVSKAFTPRVVDVLRPHIQQIVDGLLDRVENQGGMDLIEDFAYPLPVTVICEMLGVPLEDRERFKTLGARHRAGSRRHLAAA